VLDAKSVPATHEGQLVAPVLGCAVPMAQLVQVV
jgi:hypothetical protein